MRRSGSLQNILLMRSEIMNVILLSGGSGKRLWPLSNDVRSKQFIKMFKDEEGEYESMVQRVYRQITTTVRDAHVTVATSLTQMSSLHNQIGDDVDVSVEPLRKDTFPAIALAAAYLHDKKKVGEDEPVIVVPVDTFVEDAYYKTLEELADLVNKDNSNITLIGIEPTYATNKYGYIIPDAKDKVSKVKEFKEKPERAKAEEYLKSGALWNSGIFAFKMSYILDKCHSLINFTDYEDLYGKFAELDPISFDYAVLEKESNISVLRYSGDWKDVGTWNTMSEVMSDKVIGKAELDEETENTNVYNELGIPILVMGAKNMVVAASGDGILVTDKERSRSMKPYVEKISSGISIAEKSWGTYKVIDAGNGYLTIKANLKAGSHMSYQSHEFRDESWTVLNGIGRAIVDGEAQLVRPGDVIVMPSGTKHTIIAESEMTLLETQIGAINKKDKQKYDFPEDV